MPSRKENYSSIALIINRERCTWPLGCTTVASTQGWEGDQTAEVMSCELPESVGWSLNPLLEFWRICIKNSSRLEE